jgi:hypothetical protein
VVGNDWMTREELASVSVRAAPLVLRAPAALDFGNIRAGTPTLAEDHCQVLDLSGSQGIDPYRFRLELVGLGGDCEAEPRRVTGSGEDRRDEAIVTAATDLAPRETLCLAVPGCAGEVAPDTAALRITPLADGFDDQQTDVALVWEVERRNWLVCNAWWLALIGAGLVTAWGIYGFIRPARFQRGTAITLAGDLRGLRRSGARILVEIRGSSIGFYRDARLGLFADGEVHGRVRGALCRLRARRSEGLVIEGGHVEMQDRRTRKWAAPDDLACGHVPGERTVYRAGPIYFQLEGL